MMYNLLRGMQFKLLLALFLLTIQLNCVVQGCTDFQMNFTNFQLSARTMDLGMNKNWTISTWPRGEISKMPTYGDDTIKIQPSVWEASYGVLAVSANWLGDDRALLPFLYSDALNEAGISCGLQTLVGSKYETPKTRGINVFNGLFCKYVTQTYGSLDDLYIALPHISIYGPDALDQHFILHDGLGNTMIIEMIDGEKVVHYEAGNNKGGKESSFATNTGYGICTNEPPLNWHYETVAHYEWKRSLARQAVAVPGGFYPEDRFLRVYMMKRGMGDAGFLETQDFERAFTLTAQIMNSVSLPEGNQWGTDSGESSGEGSEGDHTVFGLIRDHAKPALYWRDSSNPSFRRIRLADLDFAPGAPQKFITLEKGPLFTDMTANMADL